MTTNNVKKVWASGKAVVNAWLAIPSGFSAEVIAQCGFDSVTVDMQHGVQDYLSMVQCFQAMNGHPVTPMVRVPWNEPGIIGKVLDGGAYGVICPMINTKEEAKNLVQYAKYPPKGTRSNGPIRSGMYGSAGSYQTSPRAASASPFEIARPRPEPSFSPVSWWGPRVYASKRCWTKASGTPGPRSQTRETTLSGSSSTDTSNGRSP